MTRDSMNDFLCGIENWTLREDEPTPKREPSLASAQTSAEGQPVGPAGLGSAFRRVVQTEALPPVQGGSAEPNRRAGSSADSSPSSSDASEERVEVGPSRRTYTRPWSANMATTTTEARAVRRARPSSARTSNMEATRGGQQRKNQADKGAVKKIAQQRQRKREQGWDTRFTVAGSETTTGSSTAQFGKVSSRPGAVSQPKSRPVSFSLGKEQQKHSSNRGVHGKLLPWLDPKKQIKRKPLVDSSPYMLPKRKIAVA